MLFFSKNKIDSIHGIFKMMEIKYKIVTQHILGSVVDKGLNGGNLVFDNLLMKFNEKLGGINHNLTTSARFLSKNQRFSPDMGYVLFKSLKILFSRTKEWFNSYRMFIGLDMSHAAAQSLYERQTDAPVSEPTVVGVNFYNHKETLQL